MHLADNFWDKKIIANLFIKSEQTVYTYIAYYIIVLVEDTLFKLHVTCKYNITEYIFKLNILLKESGACLYPFPGGICRRGQLCNPVVFLYQQLVGLSVEIFQRDRLQKE